MYTHIQNPSHERYNVFPVPEADCKNRERENHEAKAKKKVYNQRKWERERESDEKVIETEGGTISEQMSTSSVRSSSSLIL